MSSLADHLAPEGLTVFSKPTGCPNCKNTISQMDTLNIPYTKIEIDDEDETFRDILRARGVRSFPVVSNADETIFWSGFNPREISRYAREHVKKNQF